ncbi:hypothetical protein NDI85_06230 [Halomicroarcula sp. S1AR25-4]|uniref:DUF7322 domain-containing protein n=1 Tax=Haloarcula sp. S1AR25-4 TaxID=2950538 RepID=UPI00287569E7|nr:hypothetical protein [Halomicroarcula sp. S1AR25-4]MDS0277383.1 hypothetical protein [Halomicroarcula sp. S1AR25-4]
MLDGPDETDPDSNPGVLSEKSPFEPDEFDPESLGPDVPKAPSPPDGSANSEVAGLFWKLVLVFNVALLGLSVGPMLVYFEGRVDLGIRVFLVGLLAFAYGTARYVKFERERTADDEAGEDEVRSEDRSADDPDDADHNG